MSDFNFEPKLNDIEIVPEQYRGLYSKAEDGFYLDSKISDSFGSNVKLKKALENERNNSRSLHEELKSWKEIGKDKEEIIGLLNDGKSKSQKTDPDFLSKYQAKEEGYKKQINDLESMFYRTMIDRDVEGALRSEGASVKLLKDVVSSQVRVVKDGDSFVVRVVDKNGKERYKQNGDDMSIKDIIEQLKSDEEYSMAFMPSGAGGSGMRSSSSSSVKSMMKRKSDMSVQEKAKFVSEHGLKAYQDLD